LMVFFFKKRIVRYLQRNYTNSKFVRLWAKLADIKWKLTVTKGREIQAYLNEVEQLVHALKTELDQTRNLLYRVWARNPRNCKIANAIASNSDDIDFQVKQADNNYSVLTANDPPGNSYKKITAQIKELGFDSGYKAREIRIKLNSSLIVYEHIMPFLGNLPYEAFYLILMDNSNQLIKTVKVSEGGISGTLVDLKKIFKIALDNYTTGMIISHNHPSGNLNPSESDKILTKKIIEAGKLLDINVIDHLITGHGEYFSFSDDGIMG